MSSNNNKKCVAVVFQKEDDFSKLMNDFDLMIMSPDHLHPLDAQRFAEQAIAFANKQNVSIAYLTRHPYVIDQFDGDDVLIISNDGNRYVLSHHPKWHNGVFSSGEFWSTLSRDSFSEFRVSYAKTTNERFYPFDKTILEHKELLVNFNYSGHKWIKIGDDCDDSMSLGYKLAAEVLSRKQWDTLFVMPNESSDGEDEFLNNPTGDQTESIFYCYYNYNGQLSVSIEIPPESYRLLVLKGNNEETTELVLEILDMSKLKLVSFENCGEVLFDSQEEESDLIPFDKFKSDHMEKFEYFSKSSGHPYFKFGEDCADIHEIADKIAAHALARRFPKSKSLPNEDCGIEFMWNVVPDKDQQKDIQFYIGFDECKFNEVILKVPAGAYRLLIDQAQEESDNAMVCEITNPDQMKIVSYERNNG